MINPFNDDSFMDSLAFQTNLTSLDSSLTLGGVITSKPLYDYTQGLIDLFTSPSIGYTKDRNLFTFSYDWRYGVSEDMLSANCNKKFRRL